MYLLKCPNHISTVPKRIFFITNLSVEMQILTNKNLQQRQKSTDVQFYRQERSDKYLISQTERNQIMQNNGNFQEKR